MIKPLLRTLAFVPLSLLLFGCVDDSYDLSNADSDVRVNIKDLVLPVNIEPVRLGDVIKIDKDSKIQSVKIGDSEYYALVEKGEFESQPIKINGVQASTGDINPTRETLRRLVEGEAKRGNRVPSGEFVFPIHEVGNYFNYNATENIDESIDSLGKIATEPFVFRLTLEIEDPNKTIGSMTFSDMRIRSPKGLDAKPEPGTYDPETGIWYIDKLTVENNLTDIYLEARGVDVEKAGVKINDDRTLHFESEFHIEDGFVAIEPKTTTFLDEVTLEVRYDLSDLVIKSFSGKIHYSLEGLALDPVSLDGIPDFLKGNETDISIANPQIYLNINNPVGKEDLYCETGLKLTALRDDIKPLSFPLDESVVIGTDPGKDGKYINSFVLSPSKDNLFMPEGFENAEWHKFSDLGSLLTVPDNISKTEKGLPDRIAIDLVDPGIPVQEVNEFVIPNELPAAKGRYELVAPLALNDGSHIIYTDVSKGWNDDSDELEGVVVNRLQLTARAVNNCPVSVKLSVYPIDKNGNDIEATVTSTTLAANSETDLDIKIEGDVRGIDGVRYVAVLESDGSGETLSPEQTLSLDDIRVLISGYYETDF